MDTYIIKTIPTRESAHVSSKVAIGRPNIRMLSCQLVLYIYPRDEHIHLYY